MPAEVTKDEREDYFTNNPATVNGKRLRSPEDYQYEMFKLAFPKGDFVERKTEEEKNFLKNLDKKIDEVVLDSMKIDRKGLKLPTSPEQLGNRRAGLENGGGQNPFENLVNASQFRMDGVGNIAMGNASIGEFEQRSGGGRQSPASGINLS